jgi:hypothetical protein
MLVEVGVMCVVLAASPERCESGERVVRLDSTGQALILTADWSSPPNILFGADLETALARDLAFVAEVRHVLVERADTNLLVWIAVDNPTREVRERVFQKELSLIEGFPEIDFDFNIIPSRGRDPRQFAGGAKVIYTRKEDNVAD